jgi:hypothetical protein
MSKPCTGTIPRACADAFAEIRQSLGRIESIAQATHAQASKTNGRVADLFAADATRRAELVRLRTQLQEVRSRQSDQESLARTLLGAGWKISLILAGAVASLMGIRHLFQ